MASEITYAEVKFNSEPTSSGSNAGSPAAPKEKTAPHKSHPGLPKWLLSSLLLLFLCLSILFFVVFIIFFQKYSQLLKEKKPTSSVSDLISTLACERASPPTEEKVWSCCPRDWKSFSSSCYYFSTDKPRTWNESEENCSGMAAHLVVIDTREEQDFITKNLQTKFAYFIGLFDPDGQNHWRWVDQTPYNQSAAFWHIGEPSDMNERCVILNVPIHRGAWGWNDAFCHESQSSICEMKKVYL